MCVLLNTVFPVKQYYIVWADIKQTYRYFAPA